MRRSPAPSAADADPRGGPRASTRTTGARWEDGAQDYLRSHGFVAVARNFNCRYGEIDLIMRDRDALVFVEVRYRGDSRHGGGTLSVGAAKQAKLARAASVYLQANPQFAPMPCRFDVLACTGTPDAPQFEWTRAAFDAV